MLQALRQPAETSCLPYGETARMPSKGGSHPSHGTTTVRPCLKDWLLAKGHAANMVEPNTSAGHQGLELIHRTLYWDTSFV